MADREDGSAGSSIVAVSSRSIERRRVITTNPATTHRIAASAKTIGNDVTVPG